MSKQWISSVVMPFALLLIGGHLLAQSDRGTVTGTVIDAAGAVIPGAGSDADKHSYRIRLHDCHHRNRKLHGSIIAGRHVQSNGQQAGFQQVRAGGDSGAGRGESSHRRCPAGRLFRRIGDGHRERAAAQDGERGTEFQHYGRSG